MASRNPRAPEVKKGPALEPHQVLVRPIITEKGTHLVERRNTYAFEVHPLADKGQIRQAVEQLFSVSVTSVRTQNRIGKTRRFKGRKGRTAGWKKAYVTLSDADRISMF
ncbi:50S ribosomal protein L23 [Planctomycetes bacterium Pan216]|uniref:Large ribosomal subunit protein uL23 n=1 Tax=Kolteria novifilia TaxID=2527975 RepID=A0A518AZM7_9BACT|nr:50S ribosomal protein L23 [Planctomycetes bacterium Pan216]